MKKVFIACFFTMLSLTQAQAQSAQPVAQQTAVEPKLLLASRINEFGATVSRNRPDMAQKIYSEIAALLSERIAALHTELQKATGDNKAAISKKLDEQQKIYSDTKMMSVDVAKNGKEMDAKFKKFLDNY